MLQTVGALRKLTLSALDGEVGKIADVLFDDFAWNVRYLVVDTGNWLRGRQVLISPESVRPAKTEGSLPVRLTRLQIENSPPVEHDASLDRVKEEELRRYYEWKPYWAATRPDLSARELAAAGAVRRPAVRHLNSADPHLRSARATTNYDLSASDGDIGSIDDFVVDTDLWAIRYAVIKTGSWLTGRKVLLGAEWIRGLEWEQRKARISLKREFMRASPPYDPAQPLEQLVEKFREPHYGSPENFA